MYLPTRRAFRMKKVQKLGDYAKNATSAHTKNKFTSFMNRGGLTLSTREWVSDFMQMYSYFNGYHPKNSLMLKKDQGDQKWAF